MSRPAQTTSLLSERDLCALLGVSRVTLYEWRRKHTFPAPIVIGRLNRWQPEIIKRWLEARPRAVGAIEAA